MPILFYIFQAAVACQTIFALWMLWRSAPTRSSAVVQPVQVPSVSIIICAKNEAENLRKNLPSILAQTHPDFEVVVVDDASEDGTGALLQELVALHKHLHVVSISPDAVRDLPGKKYALSKGVAAAKHEQLLLTDADCSAGPEWALGMAEYFDEQTKIVAGYGAYNAAPFWLNKFIRWETMHTFLQFSAYASSGMPYMATGRNLAVSKSLLQEAQTHPLWRATPSGDDDMLIQLQATRKNMRVSARLETFTFSDSKSTFKDWLHQKQRHVSTGKLYSKPTAALLGLYALSHAACWITFACIFFAGDGYLVNSMMLLRCMLVWSLWSVAASNLQEKGLSIFLPLCDVGWLCYNVILSPFIFFKTKKQWK